MIRINTSELPCMASIRPCDNYSLQFAPTAAARLVPMSDSDCIEDTTSSSEEESMPSVPTCPKKAAVVQIQKVVRGRQSRNRWATKESDYCIMDKESLAEFRLGVNGPWLNQCPHRLRWLSRA